MHWNPCYVVAPNSSYPLYDRSFYYCPVQSSRFIEIHDPWLNELFLEISIFVHPYSVEFTYPCWQGPLAVNRYLEPHEELGTRRRDISVALTISDGFLTFVAWATEHTTSKSGITRTSGKGVCTLCWINEDGQSGIVARVVRIMSCDELHKQIPGSGLYLIGQRGSIELQLNVHGVMFSVIVRVKLHIRTALLVIVWRPQELSDYVSPSCRWTTISFLKCLS